MKRFLLPRLYCKYFVVCIVLLLMGRSYARGQEILSDNELLTRGTNFFNRNIYRQAELYLFAYVQRNPSAYRGDKQFKGQIDDALQYAASHGAGAGAGAQFDKKYPRDAKGNIIYPPEEIKPVLNALPQPVADMSLNSAVYNCDDGSLYFVTALNNEVWCFGRNNDGRWTTVIHGNISGNEISAKWNSLPDMGKNAGTLTLTIANNSVFYVKDQTGGFTATSWKQSFQKARKKQ